MVSKVFVIDESQMNNNECDIAWHNDTPPILIPKKTSKLWLFMIGGSASGIITPLSQFFISQVEKEVIVPIFIDNQCHSNSTSSAISDIARYEEYCRLTCTKSKISQPFFFIEDSVQSLIALERFQSIVNHINKEDEVFVAFSAQSKFSISVAKGIAKLCNDKIGRSALKCGIFLPYLTFYTNENTVDVLTEIKKNEQESNSFNYNLEIINRELDYFSAKFIVGLPERSIIKEAPYQKNPFNIVQLIMAFAIVTRPNQEDGWFEYGIQATGNFVVPHDVIRDDNFRRLLIIYDFTNLAFHFLLNHNSLPKELKGDNELNDTVSSYLKTSSDNIQSLGDMTVHRSNRLLLRRDRNLNSTSLNRAFTHKRMFGIKSFSVKKLTDDLTRHIQQDMTFNPNMAIHETLVSIQIFIRENFDIISKLYF